MRNILVGLAIWGSLCIVPVAAQPAAVSKAAKQAAARQAGDLEFTAFQKARQLLDEPFEFSSAESRTLWEHVVRNAQGTSSGFGDMLKTGGEYAAVGDGCYLVLYAAIQFTCLGSNVVGELTPWNAPGNTEVLQVRNLRGGRWLALVSTGNLSHGVLSQSYHALVGARRGGTTVVTSKPLLASSAAEGEEPCAGPGRPSMAQPRVLSYDIEDTARGASVIFGIEQINCRTGRAVRLTRRYRIAGAGG